MTLSEQWPKAHIVATYSDADGVRLRGIVTVSVDRALVRGDAVLPAGTLHHGNLSLTGEHSLDVEVPTTDDLQIRELGWRVIVRVTTCDPRSAETYVLDTLPMGEPIDLADHQPVDGAGALALPPSLRVFPWVDQSSTLGTGQGGGAAPGDEQDTRALQALAAHVASPTPHPAYDDLPDTVLFFENALI